MYKLIKNLQTKEIVAVQKIDANLSFLLAPEHSGNTDYQQYLAWVAEGNQPEPADPQ